MKLLKCSKCGSRVIVDKVSSNIICCEETMMEVIPNSVDAAIEKHVPEYVIEDGKIKVNVGTDIIREVLVFQGWCEHYIEVDTDPLDINFELSLFFFLE